MNAYSVSPLRGSFGNFSPSWRRSLRVQISESTAITGISAIQISTDRARPALPSMLTTRISTAEGRNSSAAVYRRASTQSRMKRRRGPTSRLAR